MNELLFITKAGIYLVMGLGVIAALGVVLIPNLFHAALCLVLTLVSIAGVYLALHAEFIAIVQILIYVGAVMTLVIFAIMMTENFENKNMPASNNLRLPAFAASLFFLVIMTKLITKTRWPIRENFEAANVSVTALGKAMMGTYVFPFEIISVVLIVALIGSIVVAKREKN